MHGGNDGNVDTVKEIPPNSLQHLSFGENMEGQKEHKIEADHIKLPKSKVGDLQKMKQSKLVHVIYFVLRSIFSITACLENRNHTSRWPSGE